NRHVPPEISLSIRAAAARPVSMCQIAQIRALITAIVLASFSPFGLALFHGDQDRAHTGHLAISLFIGRRTRVAAAQQFNVTAASLAPSFHTPPSAPSPPHSSPASGRPATIQPRPYYRT